MSLNFSFFEDESMEEDIVESMNVVEGMIEADPVEQRVETACIKLYMNRLLYLWLQRSKLFKLIISVQSQSQCCVTSHWSCPKGLVPRMLREQLRSLQNYNF